jgi:hypothetical protein
METDRVALWSICLLQRSAVDAYASRASGLVLGAECGVDIYVALAVEAHASANDILRFSAT